MCIINNMWTCEKWYIYPVLSHFILPLDEIPDVHETSLMIVDHSLHNILDNIHDKDRPVARAILDKHDHTMKLDIGAYTGI